MTSAPRGGGGPKIGRFCGQTVLHKCGQGGGEGVKNPEHFADVLNGSPPTEGRRGGGGWINHFMALLPFFLSVVRS